MYKYENIYRCLNVETETYLTCIDDFAVDVVEFPEVYAAFLYRLEHDVKTLMFGVDRAKVSKEEFLDMIDANLATYAEEYTEEYCG